MCVFQSQVFVSHSVTVFQSFHLAPPVIQSSILFSHATVFMYAIFCLPIMPLCFSPVLCIGRDVMFQYSFMSFSRAIVFTFSSALVSVLSFYQSVSAPCFSWVLYLSCIYRLFFSQVSVSRLRVRPSHTTAAQSLGAGALCGWRRSTRCASKCHTPSWSTTTRNPPSANCARNSCGGSSGRASSVKVGFFRQGLQCKGRALQAGPPV